MRLEGTKMDYYFSQKDPTNPYESTPLSEDKLFFFFSHNKHYDIVFVNSNDLYLQWLENLKKTCILSYFGRFYNSLKVIGKGTFAKVLLAKKIGDKSAKEYAIKTFDKKSITHSKKANRTLVINKYIKKNI